LDLGEGQEALKIIDKVLKVNPKHLRHLSLKAAALFLEDQVEEMKKVQSDTLSFNPVCSEIFRTVGRIASRHYRFKEAAAFQRRACELDPEDHEARALLAFDLLRLGQEDAGRTELELAFEKDPYNVQVFNMLTALDTLKTFEKIQDDTFVLDLPKEEAPILAEPILALLHEALEEAERKYDITLERPVYIQVFDNHDDFMVRSVGLPGNAGHLGICFGRLVTMDSPSARPKGSINWHSVLWHEFMHVITLQKTNNRMPRWLSEGISVYEEMQRDASWGGRMQPQYKSMIVDRGWEPRALKVASLPGVRDLEGYFVRPKTSQHLMFGYFLAGEFVGAYVDEFGFPALREALEGIGAGARTLEALADAAMTSLDKVDRSFKTHLEKRFKPYANLPEQHDTAAIEAAHEGVPPLGLMTKDNAPFSAAMQNAVEAMKNAKWQDAEAALKQAFSLFPEYTGADGPLHMLLETYEQMGDDAGVEDTLWKLLALEPADFEACEKLTQLYGNRGQWEKLNEVVELAMGIDPFDLDMRKVQLQAQVNEGELDAALGTLKKLEQLEPARAGEHLLRQGEIRMELGQWQEARRDIVRVLEDTPHYWRAQQLLLSIVERGGDEN
jgi:tetratricopeptide (TPR) repeat protein